MFYCSLLRHWRCAMPLSWSFPTTSGLRLTSFLELFSRIEEFIVVSKMVTKSKRGFSLRRYSMQAKASNTLCDFTRSSRRIWSSSEFRRCLHQAHLPIFWRFALYVRSQGIVRVQNSGGIAGEFNRVLQQCRPALYSGTSSVEELRFLLSNQRIVRTLTITPKDVTSAWQKKTGFHT